MTSVTWTAINTRSIPEARSLVREGGFVGDPATGRPIRSRFRTSPTASTPPITVPKVVSIQFHQFMTLSIDAQGSTANQSRFQA
ncbi:hypothetical protein EBU58_02835 [bacterium]|nr:hypothetical protein [bacterium]